MLAALASVAACTPAALTPDEIVAAFVASSQDEARTMHVEWNGTIHASGEFMDEGPTEMNALLTATAEFNGPDFEAVLTTTDSGGGGMLPASTIAYARVGGLGFTRYQGGGWQSDQFGGIPPVSFDPLIGLTVSGLSYEGTETRDGEQLHRLRATDPAAAVSRTISPQSATVGFGTLDVGDADFVVWVDGLGIPVAAHLSGDISVQMNLPNDPDDPAAPNGPDGIPSEFGYQMTSDYQFSDWGAEIVIVAPPVTDAGFDDVPPFQPI